MSACKHNMKGSCIHCFVQIYLRGNNFDLALEMNENVLENRCLSKQNNYCDNVKFQRGYKLVTELNFSGIFVEAKLQLLFCQMEAAGVDQVLALLTLLCINE